MMQQQPTEGFCCAQAVRAGKGHQPALFLFVNGRGGMRLDPIDSIKGVCGVQQEATAAAARRRFALSLAAPLRYYQY